MASLADSILSERHINIEVLYIKEQDLKTKNGQDSTPAVDPDSFCQNTIPRQFESESEGSSSDYSSNNEYVSKRRLRMLHLIESILMQRVVEVTVIKQTDSTITQDGNTSTTSDLLPRTQLQPQSSPPAPPPPPPPPPPSLDLPAESQKRFVIPKPPIDVPNVSEPGTKFKLIQWKPIIRGKDNLWETEIHYQTNRIPVDYQELENLFKSSVPARKSSELKRIDEKKAECKLQLEFLDPSSTMIIEVVLRTHNSLDELITAIQDGLTDQFELQHYMEIQKILDNTDMVSRLEKYEGEAVELREVDYFIHRVIHLPDYALWISVIITKEEFYSIDDLSDDLINIEKACEAITQNTAFRDVLQHAYLTGLFINQGHQLGGAHGFRMSSLKLFSDMKSSVKRDCNLLEFIVSKIQSHDKECLTFVDDFKDIIPRSAMKKVLDNFQQMEAKHQHLVKLNSKVAPESKIKDKCQEIVNTVERKVSSVRTQIQQLKDAIRKTLEYFAEDPQKTTVDDWFEDIYNFCGELKTIQDKLVTADDDITKRIPGKRRSATQLKSQILEDPKLQEKLAEMRRRSESFG